MVVNRQHGSSKNVLKKPSERAHESCEKHREKWISGCWIEDSKKNCFYPDVLFLDNGIVKASTKHAPTMKLTKNENVCLRRSSKDPSKEICRRMKVTDIQIEEDYTYYCLQDN